MLYELHLTVDPSTDIQRWSEWCESIGAKPLRIELEGGNPNNPVQIMFAHVFEADTPALAADEVNYLNSKAEGAGFNVIRTKLEVPLDKSAEFEWPVYHECHVKSLIPGDAVPTLVKFAESLGWIASRNALFTHSDGLEKWYFTQRYYEYPYLDAGRVFKDAFALLPTDAFNTVRMESETVIMDSYQELDAGWA